MKNKHTGLYKVFVYVVLITLAVVIAVPIAWVFLASVKGNAEFYGNPWTLPKAIHWENFTSAWTTAGMGRYCKSRGTGLCLSR